MRVITLLPGRPDDAEDDNDQVDAAVASAILFSSPTVTISGGDIDATGSVSIKATNTVTSSTTSDGLTGDQGGTVGFTLLFCDTKVEITGGTVDAPSITIEATSVRTAITLADATVGGANDSGGMTNESEKRLNDPNKDTMSTDKAITGECDIGFAAAVAVGVVTGDTEASITGGSVKASAGDLDLTASGKITLTTTADGSNKTGGSSTSVGEAVAINVATMDVLAILGTAEVDGTNVNVKALVPASKFEATATSGASGTNLGVAGSLALNVAVIDAYAKITGTVEANGANVSLTAKSTTTSKAVAKAKVTGGGDATGVGASVVINIADNDTHAELSAGAVLNGANNLTLSAVSDHSMVTVAKGGATGGTAVTPVVAVSIATYDTHAMLGTGGTLTLTGALMADAQHDGSVNTLADAEAAGSTAAIGAAIAFTHAKDTVVATTLRNIAAGGAVSLTARSVGHSSARSKASADGASDTGSDAQSQGDDKRSAGNTRATNSGSGAAGSGTTKKAEAETPGSSDGSGDSIAVAAAISINIVDSESRAEIADGLTITSGGALTIRSRSNVDGAATADGSAVGAGSFGVGAAVAVNTVDVVNQARLGNGTVTAADGLTVEG